MWANCSRCRTPIQRGSLTSESCNVGSSSLISSANAHPPLGSTGTLVNEGYEDWLEIGLLSNHDFNRQLGSGRQGCDATVPVCCVPGSRQHDWLKKGVKRARWYLYHDKVVFKSEKNSMLETGYWMRGYALMVSWTARRRAFNSSRGMVTCRVGATCTLLVRKATPNSPRGRLHRM